MHLSRKVLTLPAAVVLLGVPAACSSQSTTPTAAPTTSASGDASTGAPQSHTGQPPSQSPSAPHATEFNPPGDIPDNQVFVDYRYPGTGVHLSFPEGWARSTDHGATTFTDHYNSIAIEVVKAGSKPTPGSAQSADVPQLRSTVSKFANPQVSQIQRAHGAAVLVTYNLDSAPDPVTGKVVRDTAERYLFWQSGEEAILTLTGPQGADNVDPWQLVSDSLQWK